MPLPLHFWRRNNVAPGAAVTVTVLFEPTTTMEFETDAHAGGWRSAWTMFSFGAGSTGTTAKPSILPGRVISGVITVAPAVVYNPTVPLPKLAT